MRSAKLGNHLKATGTAPDRLCSKFIDRNSASTLIHREKPSAKLSVLLPRAEFRKRSFSYNEAVLRNSFKIELLQAQTLQSLRACCKR